MGLSAACKPGLDPFAIDYTVETTAKPKRALRGGSEVYAISFDCSAIYL